MRGYHLENVVSWRDICLERLEDRLVLDGTIDQEVYEHQTDTTDQLVTATADIAPTLDDWFDGQWHWYSNDTWFRYEEGFYWWFHDDTDQYYIQNSTDGTWYYYDMATSSWFLANENGWYYDATQQVWIYPGATYTAYFWSSNQYMYQDLATGNWYYYDAINSQTWEPAYEWFYSSFSGAVEYNEQNLTLTYWGQNDYFLQYHDTLVQNYYDAIDSQTWEPAYEWFYSPVSLSLEYNQKGLTLYYWASYDYFLQSHDTTEWQWYDSVDSQTWEPALTWYLDKNVSFSGGTVTEAYVYNDWDGTEFILNIQLTGDTDPVLHNIYQEHAISFFWYLWDGSTWVLQTEPFPAP